MTVVLEAQDLTLAWDESAPVVAGLNLVLHNGETVCLVGKSGTGKTTILHALAGLLMPQSGRVLLHGEDIAGKPGRISYMLQKDLLLPNLRVVDNAALPLVLAGTPKAQAREAALPLLEQFGLAEVAHKWPSELSGGMRQRVAFARTYLQGNSCILLDEPFSALDAITRTSMRTWFKEMAAELGLSTLMITHDADEAALLADRIYVLGTPQSQEPQNERASYDKGEGDEAEGVSEPHAATITGEVVPEHPATEANDHAQDYSLTPEFLAAKSAILRLL